jgi:cytochrome c oxidase subunit II
MPAIPLKSAESVLLPPEGSSFAHNVDALYYFIHYLSLFFYILIVGAIVYFLWRYRRGHREGPGPTHNLPLELTWSVIPLILLLAMFLWGFRGYMDMSMPPKGATEIHVVGKQWLWTFEYPDGFQQIGELHVPVNKPVNLVMTSEDVIHSFFVPSFRQKMDVIPGRYTSFWFDPILVGEHHVFCTEYCGDGHSDMLAKLVVHTPEDYEAWKKKAQEEDTTTPLPELGAKLYQSKACFTCHSTDGSVKVGPSFKGIYGHSVTLSDGTSVTVDDNYIRESILNPTAQVVQGFPPAMPSFQGQLRDREIAGLIAFIKSLSQ